MQKIGLSLAVLLLVSGCATFIGEEPGTAEMQGPSVEESRNAELKAEAAALREAVKQKKEELESLNAGSQ